MLEANIEKGVAGINIELEDGIITVFHSGDNTKLAEWNGSGNDWDTIWETINKLVSENNGYRNEN